MKSSRSTAERIRPILQAMERSIETARRRRLHDTDTPPAPRPAAVEPPTDDNNSEIPRRKARPKRATPTMPHYEGSDYRAEAV